MIGRAERAEDEQHRDDGHILEEAGWRSWREVHQPGRPLSGRPYTIVMHSICV